MMEFEEFEKFKESFYEYHEVKISDNFDVLLIEEEDKSYSLDIKHRSGEIKEGIWVMCEQITIAKYDKLEGAHQALKRICKLNNVEM